MYFKIQGTYFKICALYFLQKSVSDFQQLTKAVKRGFPHLFFRLFYDGVYPCPKQIAVCGVAHY